MLRAASLSVLFLVAAAGLVLAGAWAIATSFAGDGRAERSDQVCKIASRYADHGLIVLAVGAANAAKHEGDDVACDDALVKNNRERNQARAEAIVEARRRRARALRAGPPGEPDRIAAIALYHKALREYPSSGARRSLRTLLRQEGAWDSFPPCARARYLEAAGLIDEARIALANADGSCSSSELVRRVARAKVHLRAAQAHVRAKRYAKARDEYLLALKQDRSYAPALAGLGQLPLPSIPKDPAWWSVALEALVAAAAAITAVAADLALGVLLLVLVMAGVWFLLGVACRHSARMRAIARRVGLTRISKEHVRLVEVPPLDRDGEQIVRLIHRQLELGLIPASNPSELILDPLTALDQPIASSDLLSDVLSAMGPLAPVAALIRLREQLFPRWESRVVIRPRSVDVDREVWWHVVRRGASGPPKETCTVAKGDGKKLDDVIDEVSIAVGEALVKVYS